MRKILYFVPLIILLTACSNKPYSIIDGSKASRTDRDSYNVIITGVDGQLYFDNQSHKKIESGYRQFQLTSTKQGMTKSRLLSNKEWGHHMEECKRYYVTADHSKGSPFNNTDWEVKIVKVDTIGHCEANRIENTKKN